MKIKEHPEDFVVEELIDLVETPGKFLYVRVKKRNLNTLDVVQSLARLLHIPRKNISFAGTKDKFAVTTQYFSLKDVRREDLESVKIENVELSVLHRGDKPIALGSLYGNKFRIKLPLEPAKSYDFMVNYFGEQRFSTNNAEVGKAIIMKDLNLACSLLDNKSVVEHLNRNPNDRVGALKTLDKKLISLLVNSYQSYLWNKVVALYLKKKYETVTHKEYVFVKGRGENIDIPLVAFDTEFSDPLVEELYEKVMEEEEIKLRDFVLRSFPEAMPISTSRPVFVSVKEFKIDGNWIEFTLPKGSYATVLIEQLETFL